ncbi:hypothetical protein C8Q73DRAFT_269770 [Cubamyces lactineus]|nr:hypothetical protein C8Q73DRAFT_269770 [Cubamyces lactineus]
MTHRPLPPFVLPCILPRTLHVHARVHISNSSFHERATVHVGPPRMIELSTTARGCTLAWDAHARSSLSLSSESIPPGRGAVHPAGVRIAQESAAGWLRLGTACGFSIVRFHRPFPFSPPSHLQFTRLFETPLPRLPGSHAEIIIESQRQRSRARARSPNLAPNLNLPRAGSPPRAPAPPLWLRRVASLRSGSDAGGSAPVSYSRAAAPLWRPRASSGSARVAHELHACIILACRRSTVVIR